MFTNCLLPALLLLASAYYCTAFKFPPVETKKLAGDVYVPGGIVRNETFRIKNHTSYGVLVIDDQTPLQCPLLTVKVAVEVTVKDFKPATVKMSNLNHLTIKRGNPSPGEALVDVAVICDPKPYDLTPFL